MKWYINVIATFNRYCAQCMRFIAIALATAWLFLAPAAFGQQQDLNQELQIFNGLSADQQQAILQQLNIGGGGVSGSTGTLGSLLGGGGLLRGGSLNSSQSVLLQQQVLEQQRRQRALGVQSNFPQVFKAGDTVLIDISISSTDSKAGASRTSSQILGSQNETADANGQTVDRGQLAQPNAQGAPSNQFGEGPRPTQEELQAGERVRLESLVDLIRSHNPYTLDGDGQLLLPGIPPIALAGLTEDLATRRVAAEPAFETLQIQITRLPLQTSGTEALKPFGYDLFDNSTLAFLPQLNVPVPADYVVGPGDTLQVQLYGSQNRTETLVVGRDGRVSFPQIGPIEVGGARYSDVKANIQNRVSMEMIGVRANVTMGETRTINVFVLGAAKYPGSYTVSGLATITTALFAAGGVQESGSLRQIQLKRLGQTVRTLDLYDLLMKGDSTGDAKLSSGDVIFIPPVGPTVSVFGEVLRPAIYEVKAQQTVADLIQMSGGLTPVADRNTASLVRIDPMQRRVIIDVNPTGSSASVVLNTGDSLQVPRLLPQLDTGVTVQGYVYQTRYFAWRQGLRLSEVIPSVDMLKPDADQRYLLIRREVLPDRHIAVISADLDAALAAPMTPADIELMPRDVITVFDLENSRQYVIQPLLKDLRLQADLTDPTPIVHIDGRVKVPGDYPLEPNMRLSDLIRAGGSLEASAYAGRAELSRYTVVGGDQRRTEILPIDLNAVRRGDPSANVMLRPFDRLSVKEVSGWTEQAQVTLLGEVRFPGTYSIKRGETLRSVLQRAGGLTDLAFPGGAVFTRAQLRQQEQEQLDHYAESMRTSITEMALMATRAGISGSEAAVTIGQTLLSQLQSAKAVGRLVINLDAAMHAQPASSDDLMLVDGDELIVPRTRQDVMVLGEVQDVTSHLYKPGLSRDDYIAQSGGMTRQADTAHIYVVRTDGSVVTDKRGWFEDGDRVRIRPGDAIVVPLNPEKLPALTLWQVASTILYNIAIATAEARATF
jgi:protein involved in polysaccharide export with SLBB domain